MDDADYLEVCDLKWNARKCGKGGKFVYACRTVTVGVNKRKLFSLHRVLFGNPPGLVDHKNGDTLDNRRSNLRLATRIQNNVNQKKMTGSSSSIFIGVTRRGEKWKAQIGFTRGGKRQGVSLGYFSTEEQAARAYDESAKRHYGEFANLNFP